MKKLSTFCKPATRSSATQTEAKVAHRAIERDRLASISLRRALSQPIALISPYMGKDINQAIYYLNSKDLYNHGA